ncbi:hypothetical protein [Nocardioides convexus]|uniref:hypothetical protein n=1 Tax=Nocardioides convexus TaxID=2712224 RepID=UPI0024189029|nr:hypothetical protein [Nocardioides convexus]
MVDQAGARLAGDDVRLLPRHDGARPDRQPVGLRRHPHHRARRHPRPAHPARARRQDRPGHPRRAPARRARRRALPAVRAPRARHRGA